MPGLARWSVVTKWIGDRYVLGFSPDLRFLRSQILCRLYNSPSDETINRVPPRAYAGQELCESRGGRPELSVLRNLLVSVDVKNY